MSNFVTAFKKGKEGLNFGLSTGLPTLDLAMNKIQKGTSYGVAAAPKCGKTTFVDFSFIISPYLEAEALGTLDNLEFIYWSFEIDRINKEFKFAAFFMAHDFQQYNYTYDGVLYPMDQDYLQGKKLHKNSQGRLVIIPISEEHEEMLKVIYEKRIVPLFGRWSEGGKLIEKGKILFIEERDNPTGMWKLLLHHAKQNGEFITEEFHTLDEKNNRVKRTRIIGYKAKNPNMNTICITDHVRKLRRERGFSMKDNIDKWLEYSTEIRNLCAYIFVHIVHSNRNLANVDRLKFAGEFIFPTGDDTKDSGNIAEECTIFMTLFNPNDEKYNLKKHFDVELANYPNYRSIHITESRYTECPVHIQTNMYGGINTFEPLNR